MDDLIKIREKASDLISEVIDLGYSAGLQAAAQDKDQASVKAAYRMGLEDGWYTAQLLVRMEDDVFKEIFGDAKLEELFMDGSVHQITAKLDSYYGGAKQVEKPDDLTGVD